MLDTFLNMFSQCLYASILAAMVFVVVLSVVYCVHRFATRGQKPFPSDTAFILFLLICYLAALLSATIFQHQPSESNGWNLHLFMAWRQAWNSFARYAWFNILLNMALYLPLGMILPYLARPLRKWYAILGTGLGTSLVIEILQYTTKRGTADVDDLLANTLGVMLGYCLVMLVSAGRWEETRNKKRAPYAAFPLAFAAVIVCMFTGYHLQEFGSLPNAAVFTVNTSGIQWTAACPLSSDEQTAPVYRRDPLNDSNAKKYADSIVENLGFTFNSATYYGDCADFTNRAPYAYLILYYNDGSYSLSLGYHPDWQDADVDEETLRSMLDSYGIAVPESAQFSTESRGSYSFTVNMEAAGDTILDGTLWLRCQENEDHAAVICSIDNDLASFEFYRDAEIISQAEAYARLCAGIFSSGGWFESTINEYGVYDVVVTSCTLDYQVDSKGFYQPVYAFTMETADGRGFNTVMVPALKK